MITVSDVSVKFGDKPLFKDVNVKFTPGNCYGIIGANGAGKSTFLKVLSGELEHDTGTIAMAQGKRMAVLQQNHFAFDDYSVKETVMMGYPKLYECTKARDEIYAKADFSEEDGIKASELEAEFGELGGYEAENQIEQMLSGLGLEEEYHDKAMSDLDESQKVRVLLAQAIFGNPDILLLDGGPTPGPVPSTIVSLAGGSPGPVVVREGVVPRAELAAVLGPSAAHGGAKEGAGA